MKQKLCHMEMTDDCTCGHRQEGKLCDGGGPTKPNTDHVVLEGNTFVCLHCNSRYTMNLPAPINVMTAAMNAYVDTHAHCENPETICQ